MRRQLRKQGLQGVAKEGAEKDGKDKIFLDIAFRGRMLAPEKDRRCRDRCLLGCVCTCTALYVRSSIQQLTSWGALVVPPLPTPSTFSCISLSVRLCYASMHLAHSGHVLSGPCVILPLKPHPLVFRWFSTACLRIYSDTRFTWGKWYANVGAC